MDNLDFADIGIRYISLVILLTFHEFGHAWMAMKCGDDTAKLQGRVSLNPLVHMELIGTVVLPLMMMILPGSYSRFMIGWAKPVPVNISNLKNRNWDDIWITMAGPAMNLFLAVAIVALIKALEIFHIEQGLEYAWNAAYMSLLLCFFNLIPIPPLDGSHLMRKIVGMSHETYAQIAQYGLFLVILFLQIPGVRQFLNGVCLVVLAAINTVFR
ncbi:MAG TPA: site-2 protease family protein, partial [Verrucomicrobiae bacterium]